ncbi:MAG TPA: DUF4365 domain-containing protein [Tepidisphaeraceae bacterium]|nr:DUF4365 domain-containing protein [Tepidisphaeraceae bacterium]
MSSRKTPSDLLDRRAELMAELFLQELNPTFISRPTQDVGYDLLVGFTNRRGGINTIAVEIKATERPPAPRFRLMRDTFKRLANSNIPGLLLVADVKRNQLYFAWLTGGQVADSGNVIVPLTPVDIETTKSLEAQLRAVDGRVPAVG